MIYKEEEYTLIPGYSCYFINKATANVISTRLARNKRKETVRELAPVTNSKGYRQLYLTTDEGGKVNLLLHRALMATFIPNPNSYPHINHINGIKTDNRIENLEWCTAKHNSEHAYATGLSTSDHCERPIFMYDLHGNYNRDFKSIAEASRITGYHSSGIVLNAQCKTPYSGIHMFSYEKENYIPACTSSVTYNIEVKNLLTGDNQTFDTLVEVAKYTGLHRSKFLRRFKSKGNEFIIEEFRIYKNSYIPNNCSIEYIKGVLDELKGSN